MLLQRGKKFISGFLFLVVATTFSLNANAQVIIDNLTGGSSSHQSTISASWSKHEWDVVFPVEYRGQQIANPVLYYRLGSSSVVTVNGGFADGDDGSFIVSPVSASTSTNITPPQANDFDDYLVFEFTGQTLDVPTDGIVWFRFNFESGSNWRYDIGALGTFTTTYEQNDNVRSGGTSFAVYGDSERTYEYTPVPTLSLWALIVLSLLMGLVVLRRNRAAG